MPVRSSVPRGRRAHGEAWGSRISTVSRETTSQDYVASGSCFVWSLLRDWRTWYFFVEPESDKFVEAEHDLLVETGCDWLVEAEFDLLAEQTSAMFAGSRLDSLIEAVSDLLYRPKIRFTCQSRAWINCWAKTWNCVLGRNLTFLPHQNPIKTLVRPWNDSIGH